MLHIDYSLVSDYGPIPTHLIGFVELTLWLRLGLRLLLYNGPVLLLHMGGPLISVLLGVHARSGEVMTAHSG